jgi:hypothetical protein
MAVKHMAMDELDRKIIHLLQIDGERPLVARGRAEGLSVSTVNERIRNSNRRVRWWKCGRASIPRRSDSTFSPSSTF